MKHRATVLCLRANHILLVARSSGRWALPGGRCKIGEPAFDAAARELLEETQMSGIPLQYIFEFWGARTRHYVFAARIPDNVEPIPSNEISRCRWVSVKDVRSAWVSVSTRGIVQILLEESSPMGPARRSSPLRAF
ncbi:NUDIX hydrolase [Paraburkholderia strydomiana]